MVAPTLVALVGVFATEMAPMLVAAAGAAVTAAVSMLVGAVVTDMVPMLTAALTLENTVSTKHPNRGIQTCDPSQQKRNR